MFDHDREDSPTLITRIHDKGVLPLQPTQNLQMMRIEAHKEDPNVNILLHGGMRTRKDKGKKPKEIEWVYKAQEKEVGFDLEYAKETFMKVKKSFTKASTSGS